MWSWTEMLTVSFQPREKTVWIQLRVSTEIMSAWRGTQLVPIGMPNICWKTFLSKTTNMLSTRSSSMLIVLTQCTCFSNHNVPWQNRVLCCLTSNFCIAISIFVNERVKDDSLEPAFNPLTPRDFIKFSTNSWNFFDGILCLFYSFWLIASPIYPERQNFEVYFFARKKRFSVAMATLWCLERDTFVFFVHILKWPCQNYQSWNTKYLSSNSLSQENVLKVSVILLSVYTCLYFGY